jgi:hyperosmotically inducible protein
MRPWYLLVTATLLAGCSSMMMTGNGGSYGNAAGEQRSTASARDSAITAEVKARHRDDPMVATEGIGVQTVNGQVTLTGTVGSYEARNQAYRIARQVNGVSAVINQVRVADRSN